MITGIGISVILNAVIVVRLETVELLREEVHGPVGDFPTDPMEVAVIRWRGWEVQVPLGSVVFLQSEREIEALHARVLESARRMTAKEGMALLIKSAIYTPEGQLAPEYGGPARKLPPEAEPLLKTSRKARRASRSRKP
jgi:hypothetical protein